MSTQQTLAELFLFVAQRECEVEELRKSLSSMRDFSLSNLYLELTKSVLGICSSEVSDFLAKMNVYCSSHEA